MKMHLAFSLALASICLIESPLANAKSDPAKETYPQIVRLSYIQGDVRVSRGTEGGAPKDVDWEKAVNGLPLEAGFSLATGADGRAEIEFEDASTIYLAENSVLIFNALDSTGNIPHSELALLTGTVTMGVHPDIKGETFILRTPTDTVAMRAGQMGDLRVTSYFDAIGITPMQTGYIQLSPTNSIVVPAARTLFYRDGRKIEYEAPKSENNFAAWDAWVTDRVAQRKATMAALLKQTGLKKPVPGLAQMAGQGKWVDCPGYGSCWVPPLPPTQAQPEANRQPATVLAAVPTGADAHPIIFSANEPTVTAASMSGSQQQRNAQGDLDASMYFPCGPSSLYYSMGMYSGMGYMNGYGSMGYGPMGYGSLIGASYMGMSPWAWAVCHSGSWLFNDNRYMWVPGGDIQHNPPIQWIKSGGTVGFVPINPRDVNGKLPINRERGVFAIGNKTGPPISRISLSSGSQIKLLDSAPKDLRKPFSPPLARTDAPRMEGHMLRAGLDEKGQGKSGSPVGIKAANGFEGRGGHGPASNNIPITFDHRSQGFMMNHEIEHGSNVRTVSEPVGSFLQRSGGSFGGQDAFRNSPGGSGGGYTSANGGAVGFRSGGVFNGGGGSRDGGGFSGGGSANPGFSPSSGGGSQGGGGGGGGFPGGGGGGGGTGSAGGFSGGGGGGGASHGGGGGGPVAAPSHN